MKCLGIESTAHTFSCAVVDRNGKRGEILSDIRKIYGPPEGEGIHPREASRHHVETSSAVLAEALRKAKISVDDLDIISYAAGPGLGPCLRVGAVVSRTLSSYYKIPIYPVNHAIGHIELGKMLTGAKNPLVLLVSGGHTMLLAFSDKNGEFLVRRWISLWANCLTNLVDQLGLHLLVEKKLKSLLTETTTTYRFLIQ